MKFFGELENVKYSLRLKFIIYILWGIIALSTVYSLYYLFLMRSLDKVEFVKRGNTIAEDLAYNVRFGVIAQDKVVLEELIDNMFKDNDVSYVVITDANGVTLASKYRDKAIANFLAEILRTAKNHDMTITLHNIGRFIEVNKDVVTESSKPNASGNLQQTKTVQGYVYLGMSLAGISKKIISFLWGALLIVLMNFILGAGITFLFVQRIIGQIPDIAEKASLISEGDLTQTVSAKSKDEIGMLANSFNTMSSNLRDILKRIQNASSDTTDIVKRISDNAGKLLETSGFQQRSVEENSSSMMELNTSIKEIATNTETLHSSAVESSSSVLELSSSIEEVLENVEMLSSSIEETTSSIEEMSASIKQVADNVDQLLKITDETAASVVEMDASTKQIETNANETASIANQVMSDAKNGVEAVNITIDGMQKIKEASNHVEDTINNLTQKIDDIGKILNVIDEVTDQTNLLALNAAIIASQSGEYGKSFAVVADEIKELAERTASSTKEITNIIRAVQAESMQARESVILGSETVEKGSELANKAGAVLMKISESSAKSSLMSSEIAKATQEQAKASKEVTEAITNITTMMVEIAKATQEQARGSEQITSAAERMRGVSEQVKKSMEEQAKSSKFISQAIENITEMVNFINKATREQAKTNDIVASSLNRIKEGSSENVASISQLNEVSKLLDKQAKALHDIIKMFKV